jgi:hypothetical protein
VSVGFAIDQGKSLASRSDLDHGQMIHDIGLLDNAVMWIHQVDNVNLSMLRDDYAGCHHSWMHPHEGSERRKADGRHRLEVFEIEDVDEVVEHVGCSLLFQGGTTGDHIFCLGIHIVDEGRMRLPALDDFKRNWIHYIDRASVCSCAYVSALPHDLVMVVRGELAESAKYLSFALEIIGSKTDLLGDFGTIQINDKHGVLIPCHQDLRSAS